VPSYAPRVSADDPLEALRADSGLSIDSEGRFRHRGGLITHARTLEVLWGSLARRADGRYQVRVGRETALVRIEAAPYGVRGLSPASEGLLLHLTDGSIEPLDPATVRLGRDGVVECAVRGGHAARFHASAQASLGPWLAEGAGGAPVLCLGGAAWPIPFG